MAKTKTAGQTLDKAFDEVLADLGMDDLEQLSKLTPDQMDVFLDELDLDEIPVTQDRSQMSLRRNDDDDGEYEETDGESGHGEKKSKQEDQEGAGDEEEDEEEGESESLEATKELLRKVADIDLPNDTDESNFMEHLFVALKTACAHRECDDEESDDDEDDTKGDEEDKHNRMKEENPQMVSMSLLGQDDEYDGFTDFSQLEKMELGPSRLQLLDAFKTCGINHGVFPKTETAANNAYAKLSQMSLLQSAKHQPSVSSLKTTEEKPVGGKKKKKARAGGGALARAKHQASVPADKTTKEVHMSTITDPAALQQLSMMQDQMTSMKRKEYNGRLDALLESGRIKPEVAKTLREGLGTYQFSADSADDDADLDERLKIYEELPQGTFFDTKQRAQQMSSIQEEQLRTGFGSRGEGDDLAPEQVKSIVSEQLRLNAPGNMTPAPK